MTEPGDTKENPPDNNRPPVFELAVSREEIYADAGKDPKPPAPEPPPAPEALAVSLPEPPAPATGGLMVARRKKTAMERFREHPALWPSAGAIVSLAAGFFAALWISSSALKSDVQPLVTSKAIFEQSPPASRDNEKIAQLQSHIQEKRSAIAWKTGAVWTLVSIGFFWGWNRLLREK